MEEQEAGPGLLPVLLLLALGYFMWFGNPFSPDNQPDDPDVVVVEITEDAEALISAGITKKQALTYAVLCGQLATQMEAGDLRAAQADAAFAAATGFLDVPIPLKAKNVLEGIRDSVLPEDGQSLDTEDYAAAYRKMEEALLGAAQELY